MPPVAASPLLDLPAKCLHLVACSLTPTAAGRLRTTCTGLQQVVDAAWEPCEAPVPPHRRSVPLTLEEVEAQTPPPPPRPERQGNAARAREDSHTWDLEAMFGPALTRLTANQAVNVLQGQQLVTLMLAEHAGLSRYTPVSDKMEQLELLSLHDLGVTWPPQDRNVVLEPFNARPGKPVPYRFHFYGSYSWPSGLTSGQEQPELKFTCFCPWIDSLLVTDDTGVRSATSKERAEFVAGTAPPSRSYDVNLSRNHGPGPLFAFLQPTERRLRLRASAGVVAG